jgi:hypothetical protein
VIVRTRWVIPIGRLHVNCQAAKQGSERESVRIYVPSFDNTTSSPFHFRVDLSLHSSIAAAAATHLSKKDPKLKDFPFKPHDVIIFAETDGCIRMHFTAIVRCNVQRAFFSIFRVLYQAEFPSEFIT